MRKEVLVAIILGITLGLVIAFGVWRANLALAPRRQVSTQTQPSPTPPAFELVITTPEDETVVADATIDVSGKTESGATVIVQYEEGAVTVLADASGSFSQEIELVAGANTITVSAFAQDGEGIEKTLTVVYSTEFPGE